MSYFPYPDPSKVKSNHTFSMPQHHLAPTPLPSQRGQHNADLHAAAYETWSAPVSSADDKYSSTPSAHWQNSAEPCGLGLQSLGIQHQQLCAPNPIATTMALALPWQSTYEASAQACGLPDTTRSDSAMDYCDFIPVTAGWDQVQTTTANYMPVYETNAASPEHSVYSGSSRPSISESSPYARSDSEYHPGGSPYIKVEETHEYSRGRIHSLPSNASAELSLLVSPGDMYSSPHLPNAEHLVASMKSDGMHIDTRTHSSHSRRTESVEDDHFAERQKRGYTTPANATCSCQLCGKQFQRSYNLKAHMETHRQDRDHPHRCPYRGCGRPFVRKTDLNRHEGSVHKKARDHVCSMCNSAFARKDTLSRHKDDGCSKRPEVKKRAARARKALACPGARRSSQSSIFSQRK